MGMIFSLRTLLPAHGESGDRTAVVVSAASMGVTGRDMQRYRTSSAQ